MWTLNKLEAKRLTFDELKAVAKDRNEPTAAGRILQLYTTFTFGNDEEEITVSTFCENRDVIVRTVQEHLVRLNEQEELVQEITAGIFSVPERETPPEPTPEDQKAQEVAQAEQALFEEVEKAKREKEAAELAEENVKVAEKLAELELVRGNRK